MYGILLPYFWDRDPNYAAYTYEEVNERLPVQVAPHQAPDPPRQSEVAPRKPAGMQAAFFYAHGIDNLGPGKSFQLGPTLLGDKVAVRRGSWTSSPRGIMSEFRYELPTERDAPDSFGMQVEPIAGGKF